MTGRVILKPEERLLVIINDNVINGSTRFQKYGFMLHKQYNKTLQKFAKKYPGFSFYDDWVPYYYGPYSKTLEDDIEKCKDAGLLEVTAVENTTNQKRHSLTARGRIKWRKLFDNTTDQIIEINDIIRRLQVTSTENILKSIYKKYPEFTKMSRIKDQILDN